MTLSSLQLSASFFQAFKRLRMLLILHDPQAIPQGRNIDELLEIFDIASQSDNIGITDALEDCLLLLSSEQLEYLQNYQDTLTDFGHTDDYSRPPLSGLAEGYPHGNPTPGSQHQLAWLLHSVVLH